MQGCSKPNRKCITLSHTYLKSRLNIIFYNIFSTLAFVCVHTYILRTANVRIAYTHACGSPGSTSSTIFMFYILGLDCCFQAPYLRLLSIWMAGTATTLGFCRLGSYTPYTPYTPIHPPILHSDRSVRSGGKHSWLSS